MSHLAGPAGRRTAGAGRGRAPARPCPPTPRRTRRRRRPVLDRPHAGRRRHRERRRASTRPASTAAWARQRMPFPLISAALPSAFRSSMARSAPPVPPARPGSPRRRRRRTGGRTGRAPRPASSGRRVVDVHQDQEVVAGPVVLGQMERSDRRVAAGSSCWRTVSHRGPSRGTAPQRAATIGHRVVIGLRTTRYGDRGGTRPSGAGRRRGCGRTASVDGVGQRHALLEVGEELAVAEGLAGGPRQAPGAGGQASAPRRGGRHPSAARTARRCAGRGRPGRDGSRPATPGSAGSARARGRRRRTGARPDGDLEGPDQASPVGRLDPAGGHRVEPGQPVRAGRPAPGAGRAPVGAGGVEPGARATAATSG